MNRLVRAARRRFPKVPQFNPPAAALPSNFVGEGVDPLSALGDKYQPTKRDHNYLPHYWRHFRDIRLDVRRVLEIGVQTERSLRMWEEFFPGATIYGIDIDPKCASFAGDRRRVFIGDQSDRAFLGEVIEEAGGFDIVIDDGSHIHEHQLTAFEELFPALSSHGIYVVEDTGGVVGDTRLRTVHALQDLINSIMFWPRGLPPEEWPNLTDLGPEASWADSHVAGIAFYRWIVFVMRGHNPGDNPYLGTGS